MAATPAAPASPPAWGDPSTLIACHECDALYRCRPLVPGQRARCPRCDAVLYRERRDSDRQTRALALAGLLLFVPANTYPLLALSIEGRVQEMTIFAGTRALWDQGLASLAVFVFVVSIGAPLARLLGLYALAAPGVLVRVPRWLARVARMTEAIGPWGMLEVYLLGVIVAYVKLADLAQVVLGPAFFCFVGLILAGTAAGATFDPRTVWRRLEGARR